MSRKVKRKKPRRSIRRGGSLKRADGYPQDDVDDFVKGGLYLYWLAHGVNYLHSDFEEGVWDPLFDIYDGKVYTQEDIQKKLKSKFYREKSGWTDQGTLLSGWSVQEPSKVHSFFRKLARVIGKKAAREPHNPFVWDVFNDMKRVTEVLDR